MCEVPPRGRTLARTRRSAGASARTNTSLCSATERGLHRTCARARVGQRPTSRRIERAHGRAAPRHLLSAAAALWMPPLQTVVHDCSAPFLRVQARKLEQLHMRKHPLRRRQKRDQKTELAIGRREDVSLRRFQPARAHVELPAREPIGPHAGKAVSYAFAASSPTQQCANPCQRLAR